MKAVFLVINYMPHQLISIQAVINCNLIHVHAFSFKDNTKIPDNVENLITYRLKDFSRSTFLKKIIEINPDFMVVAGWAVPDFVWVAKKVRKKLSIPVVSYSDTQWRGNLRQQVNRVISPLHLKKAFSHIWVAGYYQFEYARKLGFAKTQIIFNSLSCDLNLFSQVSNHNKRENYPKNFLYIGRFVPVKGLNLLVDAWNQIGDKKNWTLTLIGDGSGKDTIRNISGIIIKDFMQQKELIKEFDQSGCFVLPSIFEPWAIVLHEAAASGLPIISTNVCGAAPHFIISGFNGFLVHPNTESIKHALEKIIKMDQDQLIQFSENSKKLAASITPELGAAQLMSILKLN